MTADASSLGAWFPTSRGPRITIAPTTDDEHQASTTVAPENAYSRRAATIQKLAEIAGRTPYVQPPALVNLALWLSSLPAEMPEPFIAVGDDGSISSEWDVNRHSLHVTFFDDADEIYFVSPGGEEWEGTLDANDKLSDAMRTIAQAARER